MWSERIMKKITAYVRSERALGLKEELRKIGIRAMTIGDITTWTSSKIISVKRRGIPILYDLVHMAKIECYIVGDKRFCAAYKYVECACMQDFPNKILKN
jgi:nitrogen regulatory protein PII